MKILPFTIPKPVDENLFYQIDTGEKLYDKLHQHKEIQISYVKNGEGTLLVGNSVHHYESGDIVVFGGNLAHLFKSDTDRIKRSDLRSLFFTKNAFGEDFFKDKELAELHPFFQKAEAGFKLSTQKKMASELLMDMENSYKLDRFILFMKLLKVLNKARYEPLSSFVSSKTYSANEGKRMQSVFDFTMANYHKDLDLKTISDQANMTPNAFCKYFKKRTNKSYFSFLNELRIEQACKLLLTQKESAIAEIAYAVGYNNISNFNRHFKRQKKMTPLEFRKGVN